MSGEAGSVADRRAPSWDLYANLVKLFPEEPVFGFDPVGAMVRVTVEEIEADGPRGLCIEYVETGPQETVAFDHGLVKQVFQVLGYLQRREV